VKAPHGATRQDEYYWLRDDSRQNAEMLDYLKAENTYADAMLAPQAALRDTLYAELVGRIKQDDSTVPYLEDGYWYYVRFEEGKEYPIHARRKGSLEAAEEVVLDVNVLAEGKGFYQAAGLAVSPDGGKLAFFEDTSGRRQYTLRIKDLSTGEMLPDSVSGLAANGVWTADGSTIYMVENDPVTLLTTRVKAHRLGTDAATDAVVYEEKDPTFYMGVGKTRSEQYICIGVQSTVSSEARCTDASTPGEFRVIAARERDVEYSADHLDGRWVIRTNWNAKNFKLMQAEGDAVFDRAQWVDLIPHDAAVLIEGFELFKGFMAIDQRAQGLSSLRIRMADGSEQPVASDESAYTMGLAVNAEADTDWLRYSYTSMTTPATTYELNVRSGERAAEGTAGAWAATTNRTTSPNACGHRHGTACRFPVTCCTARISRKTASCAAAVRLRQLRRIDGSVLQQSTCEPAGSRHGLRHRAHSRRSGNGPRVVRRRQAAEEDEHLHRLHRRHRFPGQAGLCRAGPAWLRWAAAPAAC
jgi:oligopeptidase B